MMQTNIPIRDLNSDIRLQIILIIAFPPEVDYIFLGNSRDSCLFISLMLKIRRIVFL